MVAKPPLEKIGLSDGVKRPRSNMEDKKNILLVDDEPEIVNTLKTFLTARGYNVTGSLNGQEALDILERQKLDLILLDIMMPGMKGTEVARIIKKKYPSVKIIVVTGYPEEGMRLSEDKLLESVLIKPLRIHELYNKLSEVLKPKEVAQGEENKDKAKARILLINARILFIENDPQIYNFLSRNLKSLSNKGENYETDVANNEGRVLEKISSFKPEIVAVNLSFFKENNKNLLSLIEENNLSVKEIIAYNIEDITKFDRRELQSLVKAVEISCFKNGLIKIKWVQL